MRSFNFVTLITYINFLFLIQNFFLNFLYHIDEVSLCVLIRFHKLLGLFLFLILSIRAFTLASHFGCYFHALIIFHSHPLNLCFIFRRILSIILIIFRIHPLFLTKFYDFFHLFLGLRFLFSLRCSYVFLEKSHLHLKEEVC